MIKILRYTEYLYLFVAIFSLYKITQVWNTDRNYAYLFVFFAVASIGMFLFRRKYRKRFEQRQRENKE
ncbi:hypothetical protein FEE95_08640 [Maribacter algarum]|uniref:Uncharacterized protein n=1 Tax=Maribacter algarum (ex Zhang et al. 2020) TaxID=2578118 RepID=A0A5S3PWX6_9FLAO|nr:hypothetical protein FEE95_08640 [Maribacter algarum]